MTPEIAIDTLKKTCELLGSNNVRVQKIISNSEEVMKPFPAAEVAVDLSKLERQQSSMQRALGITWDIKSDSFMINITIRIRSLTKGGIISVINTIIMTHWV